MATCRASREKYKKYRSENPEILWTIKQLFEWAVKHGCEDYHLNVDDEGIAIDCHIINIEIDDEATEVYL